jgi:PEP-CTERM motif
MKLLQSVLLKMALLLVVIFMALGSARADIIGVEFGTGRLDGIDPITGAVTPYGGVPIVATYGITGGPNRTVFLTTVVNLYEWNLNTGVLTPLDGFNDPMLGEIPIGQLAFDLKSGVLYGTDNSSLFTIDLNDCPIEGCITTLVGVLGVGEMWAMGFVPGRGLYGVSEATDLLYQINAVTGLATPIGPTGVDGITDIAFDSATGELIASAGGPKKICPPWSCTLSPGKIYAIDLQTGGAALLNNNAPTMFGIADVVPEPGSWLLLATGLAALGALSRLKRAQFS